MVPPPIDPADWSWISGELTAASERIATSLRSGPAATAPVPDMTWDVGRLGAHVVSVPRLHIESQQIDRPFPGHDKVEPFSDAEADKVGTREPAELAELLVASTRDLIDVLGHTGDAPARFYGWDHHVAGVGAITLSELLVHHLDLAKATGEDVMISREQALACLTGLFGVASNFVDPAVARKCAGVQHLHLRGGSHWTIEVANGGATVTPGKPARADLHTIADPATLLLSSLGRISPAKAALSGKIKAYGRKPWLGLRSQKLFLQV